MSDLRYLFRTFALIFALAFPVGVAVQACTPAQIQVVRTVWDIADTVKRCLERTGETDPDQAMLGCGVPEPDKPAARAALEFKASVRRDTLEKMGCAKDIKDAGAKR